MRTDGTQSQLHFFAAVVLLLVPAMSGHAQVVETQQRALAEMQKRLVEANKAVACTGGPPWPPLIAILIVPEDREKGRPRRAARTSTLEG